jgi:hypothetical protein
LQLLGVQIGIGKRLTQLERDKRQAERKLQHAVDLAVSVRRNALKEQS